MENDNYQYEVLKTNKDGSTKVVQTFIKRGYIGAFVTLNKLRNDKSLKKEGAKFSMAKVWREPVQLNDAAFSKVKNVGHLISQGHKRRMAAATKH